MLYSGGNRESSGGDVKIKQNASFAVHRSISKKKKEKKDERGVANFFSRLYPFEVEVFQTRNAKL